MHVGLYLWFEGRGYPSSLQVSPAEVSVEGGRHHLTGITRPWPQPKACSKHGKQIIHGAFLKALKYFLLKRALPGPHSNRLKQFRNLFCIHEDIRLQISKLQPWVFPNFNILKLLLLGVWTITYPSTLHISPNCSFKASVYMVLKCIAWDCYPSISVMRFLHLHVPYIRYRFLIHV